MTFSEIFFNFQFISKKNKKTYPILPSPGFVQLRVFNGVPGCKYTINTKNKAIPEITLNGIDYWSDHYIKTEQSKLRLTYSIKESRQDCPKFHGGSFIFNETTAYSIFLQNRNSDEPVQVYVERVEKSSKAMPFVRNLANLEKNHKIIWRLSKTGSIESSHVANYRKLIELRATTYDVFVDDIKVHEEKLRHGGIYTLIIGRERTGSIVTKMIEVTEPNSMSILWLIPQYVIMTLGEVMFSVTGLEFSYSQAPLAMKSVLQACWLLTVAFGNIIVVIVAELKFFDSQAFEFFLFAGLMFVDMLLFMWLAYSYKPNNPVSVASESKGQNPITTQKLDANNLFKKNQQQLQRATQFGQQSRQARYTSKQMD